VPSACRVRISIYDVNGRNVRLVVDKEMSPGRKSTVWDGRRDNSGMRAGGVYFYHIEAGSFKKARKMVILR